MSNQLIHNLSSKNEDELFSHAYKLYLDSDYEGALIAFKKYLIKNQANFEAHFLLGMCFISLGQLINALNSLLLAANINNDSFEAHLNIGIIQSKLGKLNEALHHHKLALLLAPNQAASWSGCGTIYYLQFKYEEALIFFNKAIELDPNFTDAHVNKAICLHRLMRYEESLAQHKIAVALTSNSSDALCNQGLTFSALGKHHEAITCYNQAIKVDPSYCEALWNMSLSQLTLGDFRGGFANYEMRWFKNCPDPKLHQEISALQSVDQMQGKNVLVWAEQGYGDTIQFIRYLDELEHFGASITLEVQPALKNLLLRQAKYKVISRGEGLGVQDYQIPLLSLPHLLKKYPTKTSKTTPYVFPSQEKIIEWDKELKRKSAKLRIGISCSGNLEFDRKNGVQRFIALDQFTPLLEFGNLYLIQKELTIEDSKILAENHEIIFFGDKLRDFDDSAALAKNMDLIISVDTSLAHLSGAMGLPVLILLPQFSDWRWFLKDDFSPWYPNMRLFRQKNSKDWTSVMQSLMDVVSNFSTIN